MRLALFTQDKSIQALVGKLASTAGFGCAIFGQQKTLLDYLQKEGCDVLIVDCDETDDTKPILEWARSHLASALPLLALTSGAPDSIAALLDQGTSDYLIKPVRQSELTVRLQVVLRRAYPERFTYEPLVFGDYAFDEGSHTIKVENKPVELTQKEFALALLFFRHLNRPLSRAFIVERIWSRDMEVSSRTVDTHVSRVRNKLGLKPENGFKLMPVYSFGYRLEQIGTQKDIASNQGR